MSSSTQGRMARCQNLNIESLNLASLASYFPNGTMTLARLHSPIGCPKNGVSQFLAIASARPLAIAPNSDLAPVA
jgi:hypothetical protein